MRRFYANLSITLLLLLMSAAYAQSGQNPVQTGDPAKRGLKESDFPRTKQLAPGVYSYEALRAGDPNGFMTTVSLFVVTTDGVLVADGQGNVKQAQEMVDAIAKITTQPIKYVVICSDHGDHTGGNSAFPKAATFISSSASKKTLEAAAEQAAQRGPRAGAAPAPPAIIPTVTVDDKRVIKMGNTEIQVLNLGRAHTGGDLEVYLPKEKVLFMSEAYLHRIFPAMRSAYPTEWVATIKKAQAMKDVTWYIPGHGFVDDPKTLKDELNTYRQALEKVIAEATRLHKAGVPCPVPAAAARGGGRGNAAPPCEAVQKADWGPYKDWTLRASQEETAIRRVYDELDGKLK